MCFSTGNGKELFEEFLGAQYGIDYLNLFIMLLSFLLLSFAVVRVVVVAMCVLCVCIAPSALYGFCSLLCAASFFWCILPPEAHRGVSCLSAPGNLCVTYSFVQHLRSVHVESPSAPLFLLLP